MPPEAAHELAVKLAEHFRGHEVLVCTHVDRGHIHSHLLINSVSFETGKKLHISENDLTPIRQRNDSLCREYGFSVYEPRENVYRDVGVMDSVEPAEVDAQEIGELPEQAESGQKTA